MNIQDLQAKVDAAQERVDKIKNTISKHEKGYEKKVQALNKILEEHGQSIKWDDIKDEQNVAHKFYGTDFHNEFYWGVCDIHDKERSIYEGGRKLAEAEQILKNWQEKLRLEQVKLQYIQDNVPQVIKDFLEAWKKKVIDYYAKKAEAYPEAYKEYREESSKLYFDILKENVEKLVEENKELFIKQYCYSENHFERVMETLNEGYKPNNDYEYINLVRFSYRSQYEPRNDRRYRNLEEQWNARFGDGLFQNWKSWKFAPEWLDKVIEQEKNNKLIDFMTRVSKITGEILDTKYLYIADDGNLNGYVIGRDGNATVETIGAGGYNIQCFHYRVLIKPRK